MLLVLLFEAQVVIVEVFRVFRVVKPSNLEALPPSLRPEDPGELTLESMECLPLSVVQCLVVLVTLPWLSSICVEEVRSIVLVADDDFAREGHGSRVGHK